MARAIIYSEAPDVLEIVNDLLPKFHAHLDGELSFRCVYRSRAKEDGGRTVMASITLLSGRMRYFVGADVLIEVAEDVWDTLTEIQQVALVDHELCHIVENEDDPFPPFVARGHSIEEFTDIAERYGAVFPDIQEFMEAVTVGVAMNGG